MICQCYTYYKDKIEEGEKQFRDALIKHLYTLIGVEPNVAIGSDKVNYVISYCSLMGKLINFDFTRESGRFVIPKMLSIIKSRNEPCH
jgi:hypothetical protein